MQYYEILDAVSSRVAYATRKMGNLATEKVNELLVRMERLRTMLSRCLPAWMERTSLP